MVLNRSMLDWGVHLPNMWCNGFPKIYGQLEEGGPDLPVDLPSLV